MQITTTKKLKGVLELPSLGMQLKYDHQKDKSQTITVDDKHSSNNEIRIASEMQFITVKGKPVVEDEDDGPVYEPTVKLVNIAKNPIMIKIDKETKEIPVNGNIIVAASVLKNPHIKSIIGSKLKIEGLETSIEENIPNPESGFDIDDDSRTNSDDTTAVIANPNEEETLKTDQEIKKVNAKTKPSEKDELKSTPQIYDPNSVFENEEDDSNFVDKEQEKERIKAHPVLGKKTQSSEPKFIDKTEGDVIDTEAIQLDKLEGTTPVVMQRVAEKQEEQTLKQSLKKTTVKLGKTKKTGEKFDI